MGWASANEVIEPVLKYADKRKLWTNKIAMHIIELLAITLKDMDWDTDYEMWDSKTFREMCKNSQYQCFSDLYEEKTKEG